MFSLNVLQFWPTSVKCSTLLLNHLSIYQSHARNMLISCAKASGCAACCMRSTHNHASYYAGTISLRLGGFILLFFFANAVEPYDHTAYANSNLGNSTRMTPNLQLQEPLALSLRFQSVDVRSLNFAYVRHRLIETKFLVWARAVRANASSTTYPISCKESD
jgi:hypothetical protein